MRAILCAAGSPVRLWRNNVGVLKDATGQYVSFGLGKGSADLVGLITGSGRFLGVEIKLPGRYQKPEQKAWQKTIQSFGGVAVVIKSVEEARDFLRRVSNGEV